MNAWDRLLAVFQEPGADRSKAAGLADVVEPAQGIGDPDVIQQPANGANGDAHSVRTAEAAELPAPLQMGLRLQKEAGAPSFLIRSSSCGKMRFQILKHQLVPRVAAVGRDEIPQAFFVDDSGPLQVRDQCGNP